MVTVGYRWSPLVTGGHLTLCPLPAAYPTVPHRIRVFVGFIRNSAARVGRRPGPGNIVHTTSRIWYVTVSYCISLYLTVSHGIPPYLTASHRISPYLTVSWGWPGYAVRDDWGDLTWLLLVEGDWLLYAEEETPKEHNRPVADRD